jgi:hypothetical protein
MATESSRRDVNIFIQTGAAQAALDALTRKEEEFTKKLKEATNPKDVKFLTEELKKVGVQIDVAAKKLKGELGPNVRELEKIYKGLVKQAKEFSGTAADQAKLNLAIKQTGIELQSAKDKSAAFNKELNNGAKGSGIIGKAQSFGASFLGGFGIGAGVATVEAAGDAVSDFFAGAIGEAKEADRQAARLRNTLEGIGKIDAFDRLSNSANLLAKNIGFIDNDDIIGVFDQLITYGKLTENQINKLTPVIVDFYSKQKLQGNTSITLAEATSTVVKALEGNGRALKEYGINISDADTLTDRFGVVIEQLGSKVKGAAETFGKINDGVEITRQEVKNLQEEIGEKLIPVWDGLKSAALNSLKYIIIGVEDVVKRVGNAYLKLTNPDLYNVKQFLDQQEQNAADAQDIANVLAVGFKKLSDKQINDRIAAEEKSLKDSERIIKTTNKLFDEEDKESSRRAAATRKSTIQALKDEQELRKNIVLGTGDKTPAKKEKPIENLLEKFLRDQEKLRVELSTANDTALAKELTKNIQSYQAIQFSLVEALKKKQLTKKQYDELSASNLELQKKSEQVITDKYFKAELEKIDKNEKEKNDKRFRTDLEQQSKLLEELAIRADKTLRRNY